MVRPSARAKVADVTASHHPGDGVELQRLEEVLLTTSYYLLLATYYHLLLSYSAWRRYYY